MILICYEAMQVGTNPYGDGREAERIIELACERFARHVVVS
jgi:UDP-N-acetylglucosamine 2-epimerase